MKWKEMNEMNMEKWWNEICGRGKREKSREKPTQTPFHPPRNPQGMTETQTQDPAVGGERFNYLNRGAAPSRPTHIQSVRKFLLRTSRACRGD